MIQKAGLGCVSFFRQLHINALFSGFIADHRNQQLMRDVAKSLIVSFAHVGMLFPSPVLSDDDRADVLIDRQLHDPVARLVK